MNLCLVAKEESPVLREVTVQVQNICVLSARLKTVSNMQWLIMLMGSHTVLQTTNIAGGARKISYNTMHPHMTMDFTESQVDVHL